MSDRPDRLVMAKELVDYFQQQGVEIHYAYARAIIKACPASIRGRYVKPIDAWTYWCLHPELKPFGRESDQRGLGEVGPAFAAGSGASGVQKHPEIRDKS